MPDTQVTIGGPISGTITAVANAVTAICTVLGTPEGQLTIKAIREGTVSLNNGLNSIFGNIAKFFEDIKSHL